eukprot:CAMPEP_0177559128 /NCGR_PEP_ID=MMETSP0369-20130122/70660_1 /TAXON_ID=447022 ORGANISM="Scrippsiella hangoei-like, Strain SHHI-4" /NCGR_SAMPLE_ID=MMETSP0369 /ASSEMBLY_ACC=CAM_ASM_000364 /LENGTH=83 /DNA_ID=CAMNT_0019045815 /DNA_START=52 /DNA_END=300 /DNA_ORIENTATION=-
MNSNKKHTSTRGAQLMYPQLSPGSHGSRGASAVAERVMQQPRTEAAASPGGAAEAEEGSQPAPRPSTRLPNRQHKQQYQLERW